MSNLALITATLAPVFALIAIGALLRRAEFPEANFWPQLEQLTYYILFPALLVSTLATAEVDAARIGPMAAAIVASLLSITVVLLGLRPALPVAGPAFTAVYQGGIRFNTYLGVAIAFGVFGAPGIAVAALIMALKIPLINLLCVGMLAWLAGGQLSIAGILKSLPKNPLLLACVTGVLLNLSGIGLPLGSGRLLDILGAAALPLGLMTVGAGLSLRTTGTQAAAIAASSIAKMLILPLLAWGWAAALGLDRLETVLLVIFAALPTAPAGYILARQMGGDHRLLATLLTFQTAFATLMLPLWLLLLGAGGPG
ncbi:MAG: AEC family transporter [Ectothiorhodospiraceae bacterium]|nr:AEC family transporter [Ectothiorhodospiraceae bacterium]